MVIIANQTPVLKNTNFSAAQSPAKSTQKPTILIIDDFHTKQVDIDGDNVPDLTHGEIVERFAKEGLPQANILPHMDINLKDPESFTSALKDVLARINRGEKIDAINMSFSENVSFKNTYVSKPGDITPTNIAENLVSLRNNMKNSQNSTDKKYQAQIDLIDQIASKGTKVYIGAGNDKTKYNLLSLTQRTLKDPNIMIVGAINTNGKIIDKSADNSLINRWALGTFPVKRIGLLGIDYTGDGSVDVRVEKLSSRDSYSGSIKNIDGSSLATITALKEDFKSGNAIVASNE